MSIKLETPKWKYRLYWYMAYTYFQNEHIFNKSVAKLKATMSRLEDRLYKKEWEQIELKNPIFIIGPHRSGTTILQQILSLHSFVTTPKTYSDLLDLSPILAKKYMHFLMPDHTSRMIDSVAVGFDTPQEAQGFFSRYFRREYGVYNPTTSNDIKNYMRKLLYLEHKTRFLWKVPYLTIQLPEIVALFPDARFVYIHRYPVASINSKLKFIKIWQKLAEPPSFFYRHLVGKHQSPEQDGLNYFMTQANRMANLRCASSDPLAITRDHLTWIEQALKDLNTLVSPDSRCFLDYSTLISEPGTSLRQLFRFLELPDESDVILAKLDELGIRLSMPEQNFNHIPEKTLPSIEETCHKHIQQCWSAIDWKKWQVIGPTPA